MVGEHEKNPEIFPLSKSRALSSSESGERSLVSKFLSVRNQAPFEVSLLFPTMYHFNNL